MFVAKLFQETCDVRIDYELRLRFVIQRIVDVFWQLQRQLASMDLVWQFLDFGTGRDRQVVRHD